MNQCSLMLTTLLTDGRLLNTLVSLTPWQGYSLFLLKWRVNNQTLGQWLQLSWQSSCMQYQRPVVQIQSLAKCYTEHVLQLMVEKTKIKKKEKRPNDNQTSIKHMNCFKHRFHVIDIIINAILIECFFTLSALGRSFQQNQFILIGCGCPCGTVSTVSVSEICGSNTGNSTS